MLPQSLARNAASPRERLFWTVIAILVVGQLAAFWMVCSGQVRQAAARNSTLQIERTAMADCLRHIPHATLDSCWARVAPRTHGPNDIVMDGGKLGDGKASGTAMSTAVPVGFTFR